MTARELIEQEYRNLEECAECSKEHCGHRCYHYAAERVIERLMERVEELLAERMEAAKVSADYKREREREAYRARLDAMVCAVEASITDARGTNMKSLIKYCVERLAAIDAEVEKR